MRKKPGASTEEVAQAPAAVAPATARPAAAAAPAPAKPAAAAPVKPAATAPVHTTHATPAAAAAPAAAKRPAGKPTSQPAAAKHGKPRHKPHAPATGVPLIDTGLAARAAASFLVHRNLLGEAAPTPAASSGPTNTPSQPAPAQPAPAQKQESANFKQLKQGLNKPTGHALGNLFVPTTGQKKSNLPFGGGAQSFRNQTPGGLNKTGVPRRTSG
jgi:hypothetical protein